MILPSPRRIIVPPYSRFGSLQSASDWTGTVMPFVISLIGLGAFAAAIASYLKFNGIYVEAFLVNTGQGGATPLAVRAASWHADQVLSSPSRPAPQRRGFFPRALPISRALSATGTTFRQAFWHIERGIHISAFSHATGRQFSLGFRRAVKLRSPSYLECLVAG
jgi:hypothetical protein